MSIRKRVKYRFKLYMNIVIVYAYKNTCFKINMKIKNISLKHGDILCKVFQTVHDVDYPVLTLSY